MMASTNRIKDIFFDGDDRIEIACTYPDVESAIKALHDSAE